MPLQSFSSSEGTKKLNSIVQLCQRSALTLLGVLDEGGEGTLEQSEPISGTHGVFIQRASAQRPQTLQRSGHWGCHTLCAHGRQLSDESRAEEENGGKNGNASCWRSELWMITE